VDPIRAYDCLVPAAGRSERMGEWKPLLPFGDTTILQRAVAVALAACGRVVLVTGYRGDELAAVFQGERRVLIVENPDWRLGMFSSLQRGAAAVDTERFFVTLGDMPWIRPDVYAALLHAPACDAVFPVFDGRRGHPVLFGGRARLEIAREDPTQGSMQAVVSRLASFDLPWNDDSIHRDVDTPADLG
jgi:molybdenum cofactor cytidylyltransferase